MIRYALYVLLGFVVGIFVGIVPAAYSLRLYGAPVATAVLAISCAFFIFVAYRIAKWVATNEEQRLEAIQRQKFKQYPERELISIVTVVAIGCTALVFLGLVLLPASISSALFGWLAWNPNGLPYIAVNTLAETVFLALAGWIASKYLARQNHLQHIRSAASLAWKSGLLYFFIASFFHWQQLLQNPPEIIYSALSFVPGILVIAYLIKRAQRRLVDG